MAANCCPTALLSLPHRRNQILFGQSQLIHPSGPSIRAQRRLEARRSSGYPIRSVSCSGETKAAVVTEKSWNKLILSSDTPVLVEFYTSWCGPCRMVHRVIEDIATEYSGRLKCFVLNADSDAPIAEKYDIKAVPVVMLFKNGEKHEFVVGTMPKEFYIAAIERVLAS